jgi:hypothetical protein
LKSGKHRKACFLHLACLGKVSSSCCVSCSRSTSTRKDQKIQAINTEIIVINESNVTQYEKLNEVLINLRRLDPEWNIDSNSDKPWSFKYMLEGILRCRILEIDISDLDTLDMDGYENFHDSLRDLRVEDPGWSINNTRRDFPILLTSEDIGLMNNHLESREK